ncbi:hypothetical protein B0H14DRAFT_3147595 [Mycena olivaceomarginata]|nr:hypothetical protein B0H14DRAFT_3147595 [Mycena olivaceomarginata]
MLPKVGGSGLSCNNRYPFPAKPQYTYLHHSSANGAARSASLGNAFVAASTTICFSWLMYPRIKLLYTIELDVLDARAQWNIGAECACPWRRRPSCAKGECPREGEAVYELVRGEVPAENAQGDKAKTCPAGGMFALAARVAAGERGRPPPLREDELWLGADPDFGTVENASFACLRPGAPRPWASRRVRRSDAFKISGRLDFEALGPRIVMGSPAGAPGAVIFRFRYHELLGGVGKAKNSAKVNEVDKDADEEVSTENVGRVAGALDDIPTTTSSQMRPVTIPPARVFQPSLGRRWPLQ